MMIVIVCFLSLLGRVVSQSDAKPFTLGSLSPGPILDVLEGFKDSVKAGLVSQFDDALQEEGFGEVLKYAEDNEEAFLGKVEEPWNKLKENIEKIDQSKLNSLETSARQIVDEEVQDLIALLVGGGAACDNDDSRRRILNGDLSSKDRSFWEVLETDLKFLYGESFGYLLDDFTVSLDVGLGLGGGITKGKFGGSMGVGMGLSFGYYSNEKEDDKGVFSAFSFGEVEVAISKSECTAQGKLKTPSGSCVVCPDGFLCEDGEEELCPPGFYCVEGKKTACDGADYEAKVNTCPKLGTSYRNGIQSSGCSSTTGGVVEGIFTGPFDCDVSCEAKEYRPKETGECTDCPDGYTCSDLEKKTICPIGSYCKDNIKRSCTPTTNCPHQGHYANDKDKVNWKTQVGKSLWEKLDKSISLGMSFAWAADDWYGGPGWGITVTFDAVAITFNFGPPPLKCTIDEVTGETKLNPNYLDQTLWTGISIGLLDLELGSETDSIMDQIEEKWDGLKNTIFSPAWWTEVKNKKFEFTSSEFSFAIGYAPLGFGIFQAGIGNSDTWNAENITENILDSVLADYSDACPMDEASESANNDARFLRGTEKLQGSEGFSWLSDKVFENTTVSVNSVQNLSRADHHLSTDPIMQRQLAPSSKLGDLSLLAANLFNEGGLKTSYCFGDCINDDLKKRLDGSIVLDTIGGTCDGVSLTATADEITLNNIGYLLLKDSNPEVAELLPELLGDYGYYGIDNAEISIKATQYPTLEVEISGSPALPPKEEDINPIEDFFYDLFDKTNFKVAGKVQGFEYARFRIEAYLDPFDISDAFAVQSIDGQGPSIYKQYEISSPTQPLLTRQILRYGLELPLRICVDACNTTSPEVFYLTGDIFKEIIVGSALPPTAAIGGVLSLVGGWNEPFGIPVIQIDNLIAGASFDLTKGWVPSSLLLGGSVCFGSESACESRIVASKNFVDMKAYVNYNVNAPSKNYFVGMVSAFTIEHILNIATVLEPEIKDLIDLLPSSVLESGITPFDVENSSCTTLGNSTAQVLGEEVLNLDCYAYIIFSPLATNKIEQIGLDVPRGISFGGKLNVLDKLIVRAEARIDVIKTINPSFYLKGGLELDLGGFLQIGKEYNEDTGEVEGEAQFLVDYKKIPFTLLVGIEATLAIPALNTYGTGLININDEGAEIEAEISLFGIANPRASLEWDWDFRYFKADFEGIGIGPAQISKLLLEIDTTESFKFLFQIEVKLLCFSGGASLLIEKHSKDDKEVLDGSDTALVASEQDPALHIFDLIYPSYLDVTVNASASAIAAIDCSLLARKYTGGPIIIRDLDCDVDWSKSVEAIGEAVVGFVEDVGEFIGNVTDFAVQKVEEFATYLAEDLKLDFVANALGDGIEGGAKIVDGLNPFSESGFNIALAAEGFAQLDAAIDELFDAENWINVGEALLLTVKEIFNSIEEKSRSLKYYEGEYDEKLGCTLVADRIVNKVCDFGIDDEFFCKEEVVIGDKKFPDPKCVRERKARFNIMKMRTKGSADYSHGIENTLEGNKALLNKNREALPAPELQPLKLSFVLSEAGEVTMPIAKASFVGGTKTLDNDAEGGLSSSLADFSTPELNLDFSASSSSPLGSDLSQEFQDSLDSALNSIEEACSKTVQKDMKGIDPALQRLTPPEDFELLITFPVEIYIPDDEKLLKLSCSESKSFVQPTIRSNGKCGDGVYLQKYGLYTEYSYGNPRDVPTGSVCGTQRVQVDHVVYDLCDTYSHAQQMLLVVPDAPKFAGGSNQSLEKTYGTSQINLDAPKLESTCSNFKADITSDNRYSVEQVEGGECGLWRFTRSVSASWNLEETYYDKATDEEVLWKDICDSYDGVQPPSTTVTQTFDVKDDEGPEFEAKNLLPPEVRIPFFKNIDPVKSDETKEQGFNAPYIKDGLKDGTADLAADQSKSLADRLANGQLRLAASGEKSLTSRDYNFTLSTDIYDKETCRESGIAHFYRDWIATDNCGNSRTYTQKIIIEHLDPEAENNILNLNLQINLSFEDGTGINIGGITEGTFSYLPGVHQLQDFCAPGKEILFGQHSYINNVIKRDERGRPIFPLPNACGEGEWDENGCRFQLGDTYRRIQVVAAKPDFESFPNASVVQSWDDIDPDITGTPVGRGACSAEYELDYEDVIGLDECNYDKIWRHWTVRPLFPNCIRVEDTRLITEKVQEILIKPEGLPCRKKLSTQLRENANCTILDPSCPSSCDRGIIFEGVVGWFDWMDNKVAEFSNFSNSLDKDYLEEYGYEGLGIGDWFDGVVANVTDWFNTQIDEAIDAVFGETPIPNFLLPTFICRQDGMDLARLAEKYRIQSCAKLGDVDQLWAFGFDTAGFGESVGGKDICIAGMIETGTILVAQDNFLEWIIPIPVGACTALCQVRLSLDSLGLSVTRGLSATSKGRMWNGQEDPAYLEVPGIFQASATASITLTGQAAAISLDITGSVNIDVEDWLTSAVLLSGTLSPSIDYATYSIDLKRVIKGRADLYSKLDLKQDSTILMISGGADFTPSEFCKISDHLEPLCPYVELIDLPPFSLEAMAYISLDGGGIQFSPPLRVPIEIPLIPSSTTTESYLGIVFAFTFRSMQFSASQNAKLRSATPLWDGIGERYIEAPGFFKMQAGGAIGLYAGPITATIEVEGGIVFNWGLLDDGVDGIDKFSTLMQVTVAPRIAIGPLEVDLSQMIRAAGDLYVEVNGEDTNLMFAAEVTLDLFGVCQTSELFKPFCSLFCDVVPNPLNILPLHCQQDGQEEDSALLEVGGVTNRVQAFVNPSGFGVRFTSKLKIRAQFGLFVAELLFDTVVFEERSNSTATIPIQTNKLWDGTQEPRSLKFPLLFRLAEVGGKIGWENEDIEVVIEMDGSIQVSNDYIDDGTLLPDLALLITANVYPSFKFFDWDLDLTDAISGTAEVLLVASGEQSGVQFAATADFNLDRICAMNSQLAPACNFFDSGNRFNTSIYSYFGDGREPGLNPQIGFRITSDAMLSLKGSQTSPDLSRSASFFAEAKLDIRDSYLTVNATVQRTILGDFFQIGGNYNTNSKEIEGDANFFLDFRPSEPKILMRVECAIAMPALKMWGEVFVDVNNDEAVVEAQFPILDGALNPTVKLRWNWDFTYFYGYFGEIVIPPMGLVMDSLEMEIDNTQEAFEAFFQIKITVLSFEQETAELRIEENNFGGLDASFKLVKDLGVYGITTITGSGTLDLNDITKTDFGEYDSSTEPKFDGAVFELLAVGIDVLAEEVLAAVDFATESLTVIGEGVIDVVNELDFVKDGFDEAIGGVQNFLNGDIAGAWDSAEATFDALLDPDSWEDLGNEIADGAAAFAGLLFSSETKTTVQTLSSKDDFGCNYKRNKYVTESCFLFFCDYETTYSDKFRDKDCVDEKLEKLQKAKALLAEGAVPAKGIRDTKAGNAALFNPNRGPVPKPRFEIIETSVPATINGRRTQRVETQLRGWIPKMDNASPNGYSETPVEFVTDVFLDFSRGDGLARNLSPSNSSTIPLALMESFDQAIQDAAEEAQAVVTEDLQGISEELKILLGLTAPKPLKISVPEARNGVAVTCSEMTNFYASQKPDLDSFDDICGGEDYPLNSGAGGLSKAKNMTFFAPKEFECGAAKVDIIYTSTDTCTQKAAARQMFFSTPEAPYFTEVEEQERETTYLTSAENIGPSSKPKVAANCSSVLPLEFVDTAEEVAEECGVWTINRTWTAILDLEDETTQYCEANGNPKAPQATAMQRFDVKDNEPPSILENVPHEVYIPFFNNFNSSRLNAPLIDDAPTNIDAIEWGLAIGGEKLESLDSGFVWSSTDFSDEATCRENGIAHFTRTWTATDECGNSQNFTQKVIIEHPPEDVTPTIHLADGIYSYSPGVEQLEDACVPGKLFLMGAKRFAAAFEFSGSSNNSNLCGEGDPWDENGCRADLTASDSEVQILSVKPEFKTFPPNITILTNHSLSPENTGEPVGRSYCSTPFRINHVDDAAELTDECGVWIVKRHWFIRPVYDGCDLVTDPRLVTERVQIITVKDVFPPDFIKKPEAEVSIPFMTDYGPTAVGYPEVEDKIYHPTLSDHARIHGVDGLFRFVSYPINLTYSDAVSFVEEASEVCEHGSLSTVMRTWTTTDFCGQSATWSQTISIIKPLNKLFGDASGFQLATPNGELKLDKSQISQDILSLGEAFDMKNSKISCTSDYKTNCTLAGDTHPSVVLDSCPDKKLEMDSIDYGTVLYASSPNEKSSKRVGKNKKNKKNEQECKNLKYLEMEPLVYSSREEMPYNFDECTKSICSFSERIARGPSDLLTGPLLIECTEPNSESCTTVEWSRLEQYHVEPDYNNTLTILGESQVVYNYFTVNISDWFYPTIEYLEPSNLLVEAEGFVFVTVIDEVRITSSRLDRILVTRDWDTEESFECKIDPKHVSKEKEFWKKNMPKVENKITGASTKDSSDDIPKYHYNLRNMVPGLNAQNPSTHLLVNLLTSVEHDDSPLVSYDETIAEEWCTGLQYKFDFSKDKSKKSKKSKKDKNKKDGEKYDLPNHQLYNLTKATFLIPNPGSSFELKEYTWDGGQLISAGASVRLKEVEMKHGLYIADESSFCMSADEEISLS